MTPNWAEQVTAVATCVSAVGFLSAIGAAAFAGQQVRESRRASRIHVASDLIARWNDPGLVEARRLVNDFEDSEALATAFRHFVAANAPEAYVLYRELDYFEQLGALERRGAVDFELIRLLVGRALVNRWDLWQPALHALGPDTYPMFAALAAKLRRSPL